MILKQIEDAGFAKGIQSVDATHVIANIAIPGTIGLIKKKKLVEVVEEARAIRDKAEKLESPSVNKKIEQLNQILNDNVEEKNGKIQKIKEHVENKLVSLVDKDARHGAKSDS